MYRYLVEAISILYTFVNIYKCATYLVLALVVSSLAYTGFSGSDTVHNREKQRSRTSERDG